MSTPTDGYYFANVWDDYGRAARNLVRFVNGEPHDEQGKRLGLASISDIKPATTEELCALWPYASAMELDGLRRAMTTLRDALGIEIGRDCLEEVFQMRREVETLRTANKALVERVNRLQESLDEVFHAGRTGSFKRAEEAWTKAKETKP